MARKFRRSRRVRRGVTIGLLILASITIITLDYRGQAHGAISWAKRTAHDAFSPVQRAVDAAVRPVGSFLSGAVHASALETQNAKLRSEVQQLEGRALAATATDHAVRAIAQLDHLPWASGIPTIKAQVTALSPSNFAATVQLDKGSAAGVAVGMPVVGGAGLVGQVTEVWASGSYVRLVTDVSSAVGVRFGPGGNLALVQGAGLGKRLDVNLVTPGTTLRKGEPLTTSGLQHAQFPPGVPVATITSFTSTPSATQETVYAQPAADLVQLDYVDVMQWLPSP